MASRQPRPGHRRRRIPPPARPRPDATSHPPRSPQSATLLVAALAARRDVGRRPAGTARRPSSGTARAAPPHGTATAARRRRSRPPAALPRRPAVASPPPPPTADHHTQGSGASSVPHGRDSRAVSEPPAPSTGRRPTRPGWCHHAVRGPTQTASRATPLRPYSPGRAAEPGRPRPAAVGWQVATRRRHALQRRHCQTLPQHPVPPGHPHRQPTSQPAARPARPTPLQRHSAGHWPAAAPCWTARPLHAAMSRPGHPDRYRR